MIGLTSSLIKTYNSMEKTYFTNGTILGLTYNKVFFGERRENGSISLGLISDMILNDLDIHDDIHGCAILEKNFIYIYKSGDALKWKILNVENLHSDDWDVEGLTMLRVQSEDKLFFKRDNCNLLTCIDSSMNFFECGAEIGVYQFEKDFVLYSLIRNTIIAKNAINNEIIWELSIANLTYDRGGNHYAALTPKNDVPHQCLFHHQLLLALFCTHTAAIDLQTGRVVWEHNIGSEHRYWYHQGRLVLMQGAYIYELCPDTGAVLRENVPFLQAAQLPLVGRKTNMVGNHERIYFCLAEQKEIVTLDAATLQIVAIDKIEHNKEAVLLPPEKIYLSNNKLFVTLQCQKPTVHNEILVYEV